MPVGTPLRLRPKQIQMTCTVVPQFTLTLVQIVADSFLYFVSLHCKGS